MCGGFRAWFRVWRWVIGVTVQGFGVLDAAGAPEEMGRCHAN